MNALLDTHTFLWWVTDDARLPSSVRSILSDGKNSIFLSAASGWEIAIKAQLGRLRVPAPLEGFIAEQISLHAFQSLAIQMSHALHVYTLPRQHADPFDRLLIAQSQLEDLPILTSDPAFAAYEVEIVW